MSSWNSFTYEPCINRYNKQIYRVQGNSHFTLAIVVGLPSPQQPQIGYFMWGWGGAADTRISAMLPLIHNMLIEWRKHGRCVEMCGFAVTFYSIPYFIYIYIFIYIYTHTHTNIGYGSYTYSGDNKYLKHCRFCRFSYFSYYKA